MLIIFMAISPTKSVGLSAAIPQPPQSAATPPPNDLVISIGADRTIQLNSRAMKHDELLSTLRQALVLGPARAVFIKGSRELDYQDVASVLDIVHQAGGQRVGLM